MKLADWDAARKEMLLKKIRSMREPFHKMILILIDSFLRHLQATHSGDCQSDWESNNKMLCKCYSICHYLYRIKINVYFNFIRFSIGKRHNKTVIPLVVFTASKWGQWCLFPQLQISMMDLLRKWENWASKSNKFRREHIFQSKCETLSFED